jgi:hypothetical protein
MLLRYIELRPTIDKFTTDFGPATMFKLQPTEWTQLMYLTDVTRHFSFWTTNIGTATDSRVGYVLSIYDELFEALEECHRRLKPIQEPWVKELINGIDMAILKLQKYYNKTYEDLGSFYALGAILSPRMKMGAFSPQHCWLVEPENWKTKFEDELQTLYTMYYSDTGQSCQAVRLTDRDLDPMTLVFSQRQNLSSSTSYNNSFLYSEIERYLALRKS